MKNRKESTRTRIVFTLGSHLDLFWMGTHEECLARGARIIERAMELCEANPDYRFYIETAVFAEYFLRKNPQKRQALSSLIEEGRFELGASYVDRIEQCHGGESLIRHAVYGVRWAEENLGVTPVSAAHPDLPGMSPQVPQIYSKAGVRFYLRARGCGTVYEWQAPDGSSIVYANLYGDYAAKDREKLSGLLPSLEGSSGTILMRGGYGDLVMPDDSIIDLVRWAREKWPGFEFSIASPSAVLLSVPKENLPSVRGEFPFGWSSAATVHAELFRLDGELENLLLNTEKFGRVAQILGHETGDVRIRRREIDRWSRTGMLAGDIWGEEIPTGREIEETWKYELFTQDHNYQGHHGAQSEFDKVKLKKHALSYAGAILEESLAHIVSLVPAKKPASLLVVFNPLSWNRTDVAALPTSEHPTNMLDVEGRPVPVQLHDGRAFFTAERVPGIGYASYYLEEGDGPEGTPTAQVRCDERGCSMENRFFRLSIDTCSGNARSIYDKGLGIELVEEDSGLGFGEFVSYEDPGVDVRYGFTGEKTRDSDSGFRLSELCNGPVFALCAVEGDLLDCKVRKEFILYAKIRRIDLRVTLFWWGKRGEHVRLSFPFSSAEFQSTRYGVPFHSVEWPRMMEGMDDQRILAIGEQDNGELSPEDRYHFREVVKWLAVGYADRTVSLATPTSSFRIDDSTIQAVLLRTQYSCRDADLWSLNQGRHDWTFRISSEGGDWQKAKSYRHGWELVNPMRAVGSCTSPNSQESELAPSQNFCSVSSPNIMVTALKKADRQEKTVVRLVEMEGRNTETRLRFFMPVEEAYEVDLLERNENRIQCRDREVSLSIRAHEIKTLLLV